jgi:hypothetical protein
VLQFRSVADAPQTPPGPDEEAPGLAKQRAAGYRNDLQRLVAISFSAGELSKYAERWRIFTNRDGGSESGARALVRALEGRRKLGSLISSLRAHKPLVEWPDPPPMPTIPQEPVMSAEGIEELDAEADTDEGDELEEATSVRADVPTSTRERREPLIDPYIERESKVTSPSASYPRWLPMLAIGLAGVAVGATGMFLLQPARKSAKAAPAGVAKLAMEHLRDRVDAVADACRVPSEGDSARDVLGAAFAECGVPEIRPRSRLATPLQTVPASPPPKVQPRRPLRGRPPTGRQSPSGTGCLDGCQDVYTSCAKATCGPEPRSAAENAAWSRCLQECQSKRMRCRQVCR